MRCKKRDKETEDISFLKKIREGYIQLAKEKKFFIIDGQKDIVTIHEDILKIWNRL
jgi:dTMP kinase